MRRYGWLVVGLLLLAFWAWQQRAPALPGSTPQPGASRPASLPDATPTRPARTQRDDARWPAYLPREALATLQRIEQGGPHPHRQDGGVFQNREGRLPRQAGGYYREYTVETPGSRDRGARRIVAGGDPPVEFFYTDDHYGSFRRFDAVQAGNRR
jgi:guanyl-specific ribonuclease Sa